MDYFFSIDSLPVELYTNDEVLSGYICCPSSSRLLDILNSANEFCQFDGFYKPGDDDHQDETNRLCIRRTAINFMAVNDVDLGRGKGAVKGRKAYPVVEKSPILVTLRLQNYIITGYMHYNKEQTIEDLMNCQNTFLPLTEVNISCNQRLYGSRPFIAVNKQQIIWSQEEQKPRQTENFFH